MNSWYHRRKHDYETNTKRLNKLKELKKRGFMRIDKEISVCTNRLDEALKRMIWYRINH
jgi:hypothetical protein